MPDFDEGLATLARYAERTGHLDTAEGIRLRAGRRRWRQTAAVGLALASILAVGTGIALHRADARSPLPSIGSTPTPGPPRSPSSRSFGVSQKESRIDRSRAYRLVPFSDLTQGGLVIGSDQRIVVSSGQWTRFTAATTTSGNREWMIRLDEAGGSRCVAAQADGGLGIGACLSSDPTVRFTLETAYDPEGRKMFEVVQGDRWLRWDQRTNRVFLAAAPWEAQVMTAWLFDDQGPST